MINMVMSQLAQFCPCHSIQINTVYNSHSCIAHMLRRKCTPAASNRDTDDVHGKATASSGALYRQLRSDTIRCNMQTLKKWQAQEIWISKRSSAKCYLCSVPQSLSEAGLIHYGCTRYI